MTVFILQLILNGLMLGMTYTLMASGLTLVYGIGKIINFAHGEFYMLSGLLVCWLCTVKGLNYWLSLVIAVVLCATLGWVVDKVFYSRARGDFMRGILLAVGVAYIFTGGAYLIFGERNKSVTSPVTGIWNFFGASLSAERIVVILAAIIIIAGLWLLVDRLKIGKAMRATAEDREIAALQGIKTEYICSFTMVVGCGLAAVAGGLVAPLFIVNPFIGAKAVFRAFIVILLGGTGSIVGSLVGGLLVGFTEAIGYTFIGTYAELIIFAMLIVVLIFKPAGLFGKEELEL